MLRPLREMFSPEDHPRLLVGLEVSDDAAIYQITDELAVIQTVDFFPPVVDDPYDYGAIAAANAMSDVYAMGGEVTLVLNIAGFPPQVPKAMIGEILRGGGEKVREAGAVVAGGHTVEIAEPLYGMAVMGLVHPQRVLTKAAVRPGDTLLLTKPLGVGMVTTALKGDVADEAHVRQAVSSMKRLNRLASQLIHRVGGVTACTDITGFGLLGHGYEMAEKSGVQLRFRLPQLPFVDGAVQYANDWLFPAGSCRNEACYRPHVTFVGVEEEMQMLLFTPETSGGLLVAASPDRAEALMGLLAQEGQGTWVVGEAVEGDGIVVVGHD